MQNTKLSAPGQIFDEIARWHQNTVNGCFPGGFNGRRNHRANRLIVPAGNSTYGEPATALALAYAQLSALRKEGR